MSRTSNLLPKKSRKSINHVERYAFILQQYDLCKDHYSTTISEAVSSILKGDVSRKIKGKNKS